MIKHSMASLAGKYTKLKFNEKTRKYHGACPFCLSKSEVFCVDNKMSVFYCYSCGKHGTYNDFEVEMGLARQELEAETEEPEILEVYNAAAGFYYECLMRNKHSNAYSYITKNRRLDDDTIAAFGLGYAPASNELYHFLNKQFDDKTLLHSGLIRTGRYGKYDMFRNRIMFPIMNRNGNIVAFGGRALEDGVPKYINSAESYSFNKHKILYGFPTAIAASKMERGIVICEGYMDLIALQHAGIRNSSAVLGTALTEDHAKAIRRYYKKVYLAFDSDAPGIKAATRSIPILQNAGLTVSILNFSPAKDPDEFIKTYGRREFIERMEHGNNPAKFLIENSSDNIPELMRQLLRYNL